MEILNIGFQEISSFNSIIFQQTIAIVDIANLIIMTVIGYIVLAMCYHRLSIKFGNEEATLLSWIPFVQLSVPLVLCGFNRIIIAIATVFLFFPILNILIIPLFLFAHMKIAYELTGNFWHGLLMYVPIVNFATLIYVAYFHMTEFEKDLHSKSWYIQKAKFRTQSGLKYNNRVS